MLLKLGQVNLHGGTNRRKRHSPYIYFAENIREMVFSTHKFKLMKVQKIKKSSIFMTWPYMAMKLNQISDYFRLEGEITRNKALEKLAQKYFNKI